MIGEKQTVEAQVTQEKLASSVGSGDLAVFATPMMVALMEQAASTLLATFLEPGQTSVGTAVSIEHIAATPLGMRVTATAEITAKEGRQVHFLVTASDECGEIGRGNHTRFIVTAQSFQQKADAKKQGTPT